MKRTQYTPKNFAWTSWTIEDIKKQTTEVLAIKKERLAQIKKVLPAERNFENTIYAIDASSNDILETILKIDLLQNVSPDEKIRNTAKSVIETIENKMITIERNPKIWEAIKQYEAGAWKKERIHLGTDDKKLFCDTFLTYKRMGFDLAPIKQKKVQWLEQRLSKLSNEFRNNINSYKDHIVVTEAELAGLPERYRAGLKKDKKGSSIVTLAYPDFHPFMEMAENEAKRKELNEKYLRKGGEKNMKVLKEMLAVRAEHATLLGYKSHADYKTELRMAKSGKAAFDFNLGLLNRVAKSGMKDLMELRDLKREITGNKKAEIQTYDTAYYGQLLQKKRFHFDSEEVRAYFPLARVLDGTFKIYSTLFNVSFEKTSGFHLWHPDVELYAVKNSVGDIVSYFALDLYPRDGKYGHAAAFNIIDGHTKTFHGSEYVVPFVTMVTNFPKPAVAKSIAGMPSVKRPSLLSHGEVETFLHEFGHVMHGVLTTAHHSSHGGFGVAWDFVEAPSQMLEHWAWDAKPLALLSAHYKTDAPLPKALLKNLLASKDHLLRYATLRQLIMGHFDLTLHMSKTRRRKVSQQSPSGRRSDFGQAPLDANKLYKSLIKKYTGLVLPKTSIFPAGFGHLDGYDAGYYGYMWSNVFAADMFTRFEKEGILNKKTGADYKKWILEKGGSMEEIDLLKGFLGRKPNNKAFLKEIGVTK